MGEGLEMSPGSTLVWLEEGCRQGRSKRGDCTGGEGQDLKGLVILLRKLVFILWGMEQRRGVKSRAP